MFEAPVNQYILLYGHFVQLSPTREVTVTAHLKIVNSVLRVSARIMRMRTCVVETYDNVAASQNFLNLHIIL